jgi:hypothetical protein
MGFVIRSAGRWLGLLKISPVDFGQVEVIKGVASALYRAGAMAGTGTRCSPKAAGRAHLVTPSLSEYANGL